VLQSIPNSAKAVPFHSSHFISWAVVVATALPLTLVLPQYTYLLAGAFTLACCILGYLLGTKLPAAVKSVFHPIIVCGAAGYSGVAAKAAFFNEPTNVALQAFLTKVCVRVCLQYDVLLPNKM
jgi:NAD/NADP transhydrogenase beta subunit